MRSTRCCLSERDAFKNGPLASTCDAAPIPQARGPAPDFELDVVAIGGTSCFYCRALQPKAMEKMDGQATKTSRRAPATAAKQRSHLFEAYMRARQVGGDEARAGLISCVR